MLLFHRFLAKKNTKEIIQNFNVREVSKETRKAIEDLLRKKRDSFDPQVIVLYMALTSNAFAKCLDVQFISITNIIFIFPTEFFD